ncbi:MAG TPA: N,N-dimethylformamidase beta subunit family domain-containing protein, partial [Pyrinomonadaceae bacterium]|nr:N,N-dimethylformamidase beta subunit family domain-containing protein [Pyrinomonadaceae bacterium]
MKSQPAAALILCFIIMILISQVTKAQNNAPPSTNPIPNENAKIGTTDWQIDPMRASRAYERDTEGYASHTSINVGEQITFYVSTAVERDVDIEIYRMGYYPTGPNGPHPNGGTGGRWVTTLANRHVMLQDLPEANHMTGLIECNWQPTATWIPPATGTEKAVSGFYLAKIVGKLISPEDQGKDSYIIFVVRDDSLQSDFVFQSAVTTYQAYNAYPGDRDVRPTPSPMPSPSPTPIASWKSGKSLYDVNWGKLIPELPQPNPNVPQDTQARKVSFNRPYLPDNGIYLSAGQFFQWEYNFVRWMEKKGLFVSYITNIDTHKATDPVNGIFGPGKHKAFLTAGHDEYWSYEMRDNIEKAR